MIERNSMYQNVTLSLPSSWQLSSLWESWRFRLCHYITDPNLRFPTRKIPWLQKQLHLHWKHSSKWIIRKKKISGSIDVCALSTPTGCQFISAGADLLWSKFQEAKANVTATVTPEEKVAETATEQVWKMSDCALGSFAWQ